MPADSRPRLCRIAGRDTWHIYDRRRRISTGCTDRSEAEQVLAAYLKEAAKPQLRIVSIAAILDLYLADRRERNIPGLARLEYAHKPLARLIGHKPPAAITEAECKLYQAARHKEGVSDATVRTEMQALRAALKWADGQGVITEAPRITMPRRPDARIRWLTRAEADRLEAACDAPHVKLFVTIGLNTGARSGAILALTWDRVDLDHRLIDFRVPAEIRTRKRKVPVPINDRLHAVLTEAKRFATTDHVIEWAGGPIDRIKHGFRNAVRRAGLRGITPHVLRHTVVTWQLQAGVPVWEVAQFVGMTPDMVQNVYGHYHPEHGRRAAAALG